MIYALGGRAPVTVEAREPPVQPRGGGPRVVSLGEGGARVIVLDESPPPTTPEPLRPPRLANPVPALLGDPTLRPGDAAMFPDGVHIYRGTRYDRRSLSDFVPVEGARALPPLLREHLQRLRAGWNGAWDEHGAPESVGVVQAFTVPRPSHGFEVVRAGR